jgi:hypothetical protein
MRDWVEQVSAYGNEVLGELSDRDDYLPEGDRAIHAVLGAV